MVIAMKHLRWVLVLLAILCYIYLLPRPVYAVTPPTNPAVGQIGVFEDPAGSTTLAQLLAPGTPFIDLTTRSSFKVRRWGRLRMQSYSPSP